MPARANVRDADVPASWSGTLPPVGAVDWKVTLCRASENCQVTEPPAEIVTSDGLKVAFGVVTVTVDPLGGGVVGGGEPVDAP